MKQGSMQGVPAHADTVALSFADSVDQFLSNHVLWLVPLMLIIMQIVFKLYLGKRPSEIETWKQILWSPVEIGFLAVSFMASLVLTDATNVSSRFSAVLLFVVLLAVSTLISRLSPKGMGTGARWKAGSLAVLNFAITLCMLVYSISRLKGSDV